MKQLSKAYLAETASSEALLSLPEKVLQFGTGVLLRGLPDYLIDKANRQGIFNGRIVVVKSTDSGDLDAFANQDNLYTLCIQGIEGGVEVSENIICAAISRTLTASTQWQAVLDCARNPELQIVLSNTTEVGIQLVPESIRQMPPASFPAKLLAFLEARFRAFQGDPEKGMVVVPTELIPDNGTELKSILLELAHLNELEFDFMEWLDNSVICCNSLVDRIVPGKPDEATAETLAAALGYTDDLLITTEPYCLWAIEGDEQVRNVLSFQQADARTIIAPNIDRFRELKLRLLNGTHTLSCGLAFLCQYDTVRAAMEDSLMANFIEHMMLEELAPAIPYQLSEGEAREFGQQVLDRFRNPFAAHRWIQITVQYTSKMRMRNVPTLLKHYERFGTVPAYFALGFAAYLRFMKAEEQTDGKFFGKLNGQSYPIQDGQAAFFYEQWQQLSAKELAPSILKNEALWGTDLTKLSGFSEQVTSFLIELESKPARAVLAILQLTAPSHSSTTTLHES